MCPACHGVELSQVDATGRGTVVSWGSPQQPQSPRFQYPMVSVLVELEEGTRLASELVGTPLAEVRVGLPVVVDFLEVADGAVVPVFVKGES